MLEKNYHWDICAHTILDGELLLRVTKGGQAVAGPLRVQRTVCIDPKVHCDHCGDLIKVGATIARVTERRLVQPYKE